MLTQGKRLAGAFMREEMREIRQCQQCGKHFETTRPKASICSIDCQRICWAKNSKRYRKNNHEKVMAYKTNRRKSCRSARLMDSLRSRVNKFAKIAGIAKVRTNSRSIGCTGVELRKWIERQFTKKMTWDNYGAYWHIDHIVPLSHFDLTNEEHRKRANHYTNLRPLEATENLRRGNRINAPVQMAFL